MREEENAVPEGQRKAPAAGLGWRKESVAGRPEKAPVILLHGFARIVGWGGPDFARAGSAHLCPEPV